MRGNSNSRRRRRDNPRPSPVASLSEEAIRKELRSEALQHPLTIYPFGLGILLVIALILFPPFFGPGWLIIPIIGSGIVAVGSFIWRYSVRHNEEYARKTQEIMELMEQVSSESEEAKLQQLRESLRSGFSCVNSAEGLKALEELDYVYERLLPVIERRRETDPMSVSRIPALAEETYGQGLSVLADALELTQVIQSPNNERLQAEVDELEREIETLKGDETQAARVKIREATLASHRERLNLIKQQQLRIDELLYESDRCEASLHRTRIELAALKGDGSQASVGAVIETLQRTINQAKEVREELRRLGF